MESLAYQASQLLLVPVLIGVYSAFLYALFEVGRLIALYWLRRKQSLSATCRAGYPLMLYFRGKANITFHELEVFALRKLELVRMVTRITPMLGLIATLIPMGPALIALQENNSYEMSVHLSAAFTAVTISLSAASLTFGWHQSKNAGLQKSLFILKKSWAAHNGFKNSRRR